MEPEVEVLVPKRIFHPFQCRLPPDSQFPQHDPGSLIGTGFTSMALGIITAFRPTPLVLLTLINHMRSTVHEEDLTIFHNHGPLIIYSWLALIFLALFAGGVLMACSGKIKKRKVLVIHPWALLLLYVDAFFWLSGTIYLQYSSIDDEHKYFENLQHPIIHFVVIYFDIALFLVLHYLFATYFITAQLTVIEKFF